jgi:hypothetical protein
MTMRRLIGLAAILSAALWLGACDMVVSPAPVITAEESAQAPKLKPGFWTYNLCAAQPRNSDDLCAKGFMISNETLAPSPPPPGGYPAGGGEDYGPPPFPYRVGDGAPLLMQVRMQQVGPGDSDRTFYVFLAVDPRSRDDQGRIDRAEIWLVKCGPAAEPRPGDMGPRPTEHPFAGVTATDYGCRPTDRPGLVSAALASRALPAEDVNRAVYRWMGEGPPGPTAPPPDAGGP